MPTRWAIQNGDNNALSTWNDSGTLGLPTSADDVFTNGFTVNMVANATYISMNNSARARDIATPAMTSNNTPSPFVASTSDASAGAWQAFNQNIAGTNNSTIGAATGWYKIDTLNGFVLDAYTIYGSDVQSFNPRNWTIEGSNNDSTWTTVHTVTLGAAITGNGSYSSPSIGNTTSYRYYRMNISLNGGSTTTIRVADIFYHALGTAALAAGGSFNFNTAGVSVTCTSTSQGASNLFTINNATGTASLTVGSNITAISGQTTSTYSGNGNFSITAPNLIVSGTGGTTQLISKTGAGQITINGNCLLGTGTNSGAANYVLNSTNGDAIINGNVNGFPFTNAGIANALQTIRQTAGNLIINGNITPVGIPVASQATTYASVFFSGTAMTLNGNTQGGDGFAIVSSGTVTVNGTLNGGNSVFPNGAAITINVTGDVYAGNFAPAINCSQSTTTRGSVVNLTGNMYNTNGRMAILCDNVFISNTATTLWRMDTGGGDYKFLYSADTTPNLPPITDVRFGTTYGPALSLTGTMVVLANSDVRKDVPNDNSVGTAELTSADIISGINASADPLAVRLKNALTDVTAGNIISQYKDS